MSNVRVELNSAGVRELLKSAELASGLADLASGIAQRCGEGYATDRKNLGSRVVASVYTETPEAARDNAENNTILRSLT